MPNHKLTSLYLRYFLPLAMFINVSAEAQNSANFCYLPTKQNVAYSDVIDLPTGSPSEIISYGDNALQFGELWLPKSNAQKSKAPLVVFIHGGCWLNAYDIKHTHALSSALQHSGYAVWSIEYRRTGDKGGGWPGSFNDIKLALKHILSSDRTDINSDNVALVGHSAGGHLALLVGSELKENTSIKAVIGLAAITDVAEYAQGQNSCQTATPKFFNATPEEEPHVYQSANPRLNIMHKRSILLHGEADKIVPVEQASLIPTTQAITIDGAGHFDMIHPGTRSFQELLKQLGKHL